MDELTRALSRSRNLAAGMQGQNGESGAGVGDAVLRVRSIIGEHPFAVILPVDVDPKRKAIGEMKRCYENVRKPMLAVNPRQTTDVVGTAFTPDPMGGANAPVFVSTDVTE